MKIATNPRKLAQPTEQVARPFRMVACSSHVGIHRERVTCVCPRD